MNRIFPSQLLLLTIIQQTYQQDLKPAHILCNDGVVTIDPIWSGRIQHKSTQSSNPGDCTLTLKGLRKGSYVSVPGIDVLTNSTSCLKPKVTINNIKYCVKGTNSANQVFIKINDGKLVVHLLADFEKDFIFSYFTNGKFFFLQVSRSLINCKASCERYTSAFQEHNFSIKFYVLLLKFSNLSKNSFKAR